MNDHSESYESYSTPPSSPRRLVPEEVSGFFARLPEWGLPLPRTNLCPSPFVIAWLHVLLDDYKTKCQELENALKSAEIQRDEAEARLKLVTKTHEFRIEEVDGPFILCFKACVDQIPFIFTPSSSSLYTTQTVSLNAPSCVHDVIATIPEMYDKVRLAFNMIMRKMETDMDVTDLVSRTVALSLRQEIIEKITELKKRRDGHYHDFKELMARQNRHTEERQGYLVYLLTEIPLPLNRGRFPNMTSEYRLFWHEYNQRMLDFP